MKKLADFYKKNETKVDLSFFLAGVLLDIFTLAAPDNPWALLQQALYLLIIGLILFYGFLEQQGVWTPSERFKKVWASRDLPLHFLMGSLLSLYSLFYLKSASVFASFAFIGIMAILMVANELKSVQRRGLDLKLALYFVCVFSFFSMVTPLALGFVGLIPFLLSWALLLLFLVGVWKLLARQITDTKALQKALAMPGLGVAGAFLIFYVLGWIPPVPLSVQHLGIYHHIQRDQGEYLLSHENPWWRFWRSGDQEFRAEPGDVLHVFVRIFSPSRISDTITLHWQLFDPKQGWMTTDRIPFQVTGGRELGFRGFATKKNYQPGDWRVLVETTDGREIGRLKFWVEQVDHVSNDRIFEVDRH